tara:strand:+ start:4152 stop:4676 length:525 start_codon:yes stop_codon:yes gene_type:complete
MGTDGSVVDAGYIDLKKIGDTFLKAKAVRSDISELNRTHDIATVAIEENLQAFRPGFSSAKTICTLARFNGMVSYIANDLTNVNPEYINVNHARKSVGLKIRKKDPVSTKDQVLEWVKAQPEWSTFEWPMKTLKSGKRKGLVIPHESCYDIADAFVIGKSCVVNGRRSSIEKKS